MICISFWKVGKVEESVGVINLFPKEILKVGKSLILGIHNMLNFLWVKIEEKYTKLSHAFRFFDEKARSKISFKDFDKGIEKLRVKLHKDEIKEIFVYLDADRDKFLNYTEFSKLNQNSQMTSRFPIDSNSIKNLSMMDTRLSTRAKSIDKKNNMAAYECKSNVFV
jgi:hypothetical protein